MYIYIKGVIFKPFKRIKKVGCNIITLTPFLLLSFRNTFTHSLSSYWVIIIIIFITYTKRKHEYTHTNKVIILLNQNTIIIIIIIIIIIEVSIIFL